MSTVKVKVRVSTNKVGSESWTLLEFDQDDWESMTPEEKEEACMETMFEMIEWNWEEE